MPRPLLLGLLAACVARPAPAPSPRRPLASADGGLLFGYWGLNGHHDADAMAALRQDPGMNVFQVASEDPAQALGNLLPAARRAGLRVHLRLSGDHDAYTRDGRFDLGAWKASLDRWSPAALEPFIADGTLAGHMLLDDILTFPRQDPRAEELDEMARYSKERFPGLMTWIRAQATHIPTPKDGRFHHLDACTLQYQARDGALGRYIEVETRRAAALDLGLIVGLNLADGGDGRAERQGWRGPGFHPMSPEEILEYGRALLAIPEAGMVLNWEYDGVERWPDGTVGAELFGQPAYQAALRTLWEESRQRRPGPLVREALNLSPADAARR